MVAELNSTWQKIPHSSLLGTEDIGQVLVCQLGPPLLPAGFLPPAVVMVLNHSGLSCRQGHSF